VIGAALMAATLSCVRYGRFTGFSTRGGTCDGACQHYLSCKDDERPEAFRACVADCRDIFVYQGEPDRESLRTFEGLECKDAIAYVEGDDDRSRPGATSRQPGSGTSRVR
jgi:hypothetical protein